MQKARHHGTEMAALTACRRTVSGTISLPCYGCFSPFPPGTCALSVSGECLALADGPAGFTRGSTCPALLRVPLGFTILRVPDYHRLWCDFPDTSPRLDLAVSRPYNPARTGIRTVWALPRSLATTGGITFCFLFLWVLRCFSSPGSPPPYRRMAVRQTAGLPHSGIRGSTVACTSPRLFAACRALHRLPEPQASAVRPFLLSPAPESLRNRGRIPRNSPAPGKIRTGRCPAFLYLFCSSMSMTDCLPHGENGVENNGFEPLTPCLQSRCSSQLS